MTEAEWLASDDSRRMSLHLLRGGTKPPTRKLRLFAVACCRRAWERIPTEEARQLVVVLEAYLEKRATWRDVLERRKAADAVYGPHYNAWSAGQSNSAPYAWAAHQAAGHTARQILYAADCTKGRPHGQHLGDTGLDPEQAALLRDIFGNPFRPVAFDPAWQTDTAVSLARVVYDTRDFAAMPILADALQDAGCEHAGVLDHCRGSGRGDRGEPAGGSPHTTGPHVRGCWVVDLVSGRRRV